MKHCDPRNYSIIRPLLWQMLTQTLYSPQSYVNRLYNTCLETCVSLTISMTLEFYSRTPDSVSLSGGNQLIFCNNLCRGGTVWSLLLIHRKHKHISHRISAMTCVRVSRGLTHPPIQICRFIEAGTEDERSSHLCEAGLVIIDIFWVPSSAWRLLSGVWQTG